MDFGSVKNLNPLKDLSTPASNRPEAPASTQAQGPSFGSVLAARTKPAAAPKAAAPKREARFESDDAAVESKTNEFSAPTAPTQMATAPAAPAAKKPGDKTIDADTEDAWGEFLTQMDEQLNVKPADVLSAFEHLSDDDLNAKPEDTTDQMVAAMGLTGQSALLAKQLLTKLIDRTEKPATELAPEANPIADLHDAQNLSRALDRMDAALLMNKKPAALAPSVPGAPAESFEKNTSLADLTASTSEDAPAETPVRAAAPADTPALANPVAEATPRAAVPAPTAAPVNAAAMNALVDQMQAVTQPETAAPAPRVDQLIRNIANGTAAEASAPPIAALGDDEVESIDSREWTAPAAKSASKALDALIAKATKFASDQQSTDDGDTDEDRDLDAEMTGLADGRVAAAAPKSSEFAAKLSPDVAATAAGPAGAPDLVENARLMVRDGGGEMKVTVNSEVGEIEMKVSVVDGKVSVQMVAETDEAKQILETQLGDLKSQLTAHQLQIDKLQVDTGSNLGHQADRDPSQNQRQASSDAWNQMNQQNRNPQQQSQARRQMYDAPAARSYGAPTARNVSPAPAAARSSNSRRLNLVA